jgi:hypothetical protein
VGGHCDSVVIGGMCVGVLVVAYVLDMVLQCCRQMTEYDRES